jgi:hypothetical protein
MTMNDKITLLNKMLSVLQKEMDNLKKENCMRKINKFIKKKIQKEKGKDVKIMDLFREYEEWSGKKYETDDRNMLLRIMSDQFKRKGLRYIGIKII